MVLNQRILKKAKTTETVDIVYAFSLAYRRVTIKLKILEGIKQKSVKDECAIPKFRCCLVSPE